MAKPIIEIGRCVKADRQLMYLANQYKEVNNMSVDDYVSMCRITTKDGNRELTEQEVERLKKYINND